MIFNGFKFERHYFIVKKEEVLNVIDIMNNCNSISGDADLRIGDCQWIGENMWFIHFTISRKKWDKLFEELNNSYELKVKSSDKDVYLEKRIIVPEFNKE